MRPRGAGCSGTNSGDAEAELFKEGADLGCVVALEFNLAVADCATTAAGLAGLAGEVLDFGIRDSGFEIRDDHNGFSSSLGFFAAENDAAHFCWGDGLRYQGDWRKGLGGGGEALDL